MPSTLPADVLIRVKECELCRQTIRVVGNPAGGREMAFDVPSGEEHECWDLPEGSDVLILNDEGGCDC